MAKLLVKGGKKLNGKIKIAGNKNSALKLIAASLLSKSPVVLHNVPQIRDVEVMMKIIESLGVKVKGQGTNVITIDPSGLSKYELDPELSGRIRASMVLAAPLVAKFGRAIISPPGGDQIGERLLDTHFSMMKNFGIDVQKKDGKYLLLWKEKKASDIFLEEASVTATEMGLILASSLDKTTRIDDAASEPHVADLAKLLSKMGAKISGGGTNTLIIEGSNKLKGVEHSVVPDHIEGGTFAIAACLTGGEVTLENAPREDYHMILHYLTSMGVKWDFIDSRTLRIRPSGLIAMKRKFQTRPWPGFPTDLMSPFIVLATQTQGTVLCHDWMYEWRIFFVDDLISMGANIFIADPHRVIVSGVTQLHADKLFCKDIRAGISLVLAALVAKGTSEINNIEMVDRGYEKIEDRFKSLGAEIKRVS